MFVATEHPHTPPLPSPVGTACYVSSVVGEHAVPQGFSRKNVIFQTGSKKLFEKFLCHIPEHHVIVSGVELDTLSFDFAQDDCYQDF